VTILFSYIFGPFSIGNKQSVPQIICNNVLKQYKIDQLVNIFIF